MGDLPMLFAEDRNKLKLHTAQIFVGKLFLAFDGINTFYAFLILQI